MTIEDQKKIRRAGSPSPHDGNQWSDGSDGQFPNSSLDQLELQLEELEAAATEDALAVEQVAPDAQTTVTSFTRRKPSRKQFPEHLPRDSRCLQR